MSLDTAIERGRRKQESLFRDICVITRAPTDEEPVFDEGTGDYTDPDRVTVYEGKCEVKPADLVGSDTIAGDREIRLSSFRAKVPVNTPIEIDDELLVTSSTYDADLVGTSFRVSDVLLDGRQIARVLVLQLVS